MTPASSTASPEIDRGLTSSIRLYLKRRKRLERFGLKRFARWLRKRYEQGRGVVKIPIHGREMFINAGNPYPFILLDHPFFNRPLTSLVKAVARARGRKITVIDCGASIGNTVVQLSGECGQVIETIHSIEGDDEFIPLLRANASQNPPTIIHEAMIARRPGKIPTLVKHHQGTAGAVGEGFREATTIDLLFENSKAPVDVLKVDIDGYDGEAVLGATALIRRNQPAVIFEWHPHLWANAKNDLYEVFDSLKSAGYQRFLFFFNTGHFSHFGTGDRTTLETWATYFRQLQPVDDPHFDVVALPPSLDACAVPIACLERAPAR